MFVYKGHPEAIKKAFDSEKEWRRWLFLMEEMKAGTIQGLRRGRRFDLHGPNGAKLTYYRADFTYIRNGALIVEDVKSPMTRRLRLYQIKKAWVKDEWGIDLLET